MGIQQQFNQMIEDFLKSENMAPTAFGLKFNGNPNFIESIRKGRNSTSKTIDACMTWMDSYDE